MSNLELKYKRILLKLSGEALAGEKGHGIDFDTVISALKKVGYKGYCTLEADTYLSAYNKDNVFRCLKFAADYIFKRFKAISHNTA